MNIFITILTNKIFYGTVFSWFFAQLIKVFFYLYKRKKFNFYWLIDSGGMPSAHSAYVSCLTTMIGLKCGFDTPIFTFVLCFSIIIIVDAAGFRRAAGKQAKTLNEIIKNINQGQKIQYAKVKELLGHTPIEVFIGTLLGIILGVIFY